MQDRIDFKEIAGNKVVVIDYSNLKEKEFLECVFYTMEKLNNIDQKLNFLILLEGCEFGTEIIGNLKTLGKRIQPFVIRSAVVGVSPKSKPFFNIYLKFTRSKIKSFDNPDLALKYILNS